MVNYPTQHDIAQQISESKLFATSLNATIYFDPANTLKTINYFSNMPTHNLGQTMQNKGQIH